MSRPSQKKSTRQNREHQRKVLRQRKQKNIHHPSPLLPDFPAERVGAPAAGYNWLGQKVASFLGLRKD